MWFSTQPAGTLETPGELLRNADAGPQLQRFCFNWLWSWAWAGLHPKGPQLFLMHNHSGEHGSLEGRAGSTANPRVRRARAGCCAYNSAWGLEGFLGELRPETTNHHALGPGTGRGKGGEDSRRWEQHSSRPRVKMGTGRGCHPHKGFELCPGALGSRGGKSLRLHLRKLLQL